jgi:hypothetical protein
MKRLLMLAILLFPIDALCSPFLVCDSQATVTHYKITGDTFWTGNITAQADGSIRSELATIPAGAHTISVVAFRTDATWGEVCSTPAPFSFSRPGPPLTPVNVKLLP